MPDLIKDENITYLEKLIKSPLVSMRIARLLRQSWKDSEKFAKGVESFSGWRFMSDLSAFCLVDAVCIASEKVVSDPNYRGKDGIEDLKDSLYNMQSTLLGGFLGSLASPEADKSARSATIKAQRNPGGFKDVFVGLLRALAPRSGANPMYADAVYSKFEAKLKKVTPWKKFFHKETTATSTRKKIADILKANFSSAVAAKAIAISQLATGTAATEAQDEQQSNKNVAQFVNFLLATTERKTRQRLKFPKDNIDTGNLSNKDLQLALKNLGVVVTEVLKEKLANNKERVSYRNAARLLRDNFAEYARSVERNLVKHSKWKEHDLVTCCYVYVAFYRHYIGSDSDSFASEFMEFLKENNRDQKFEENTQIHDQHDQEFYDRMNYAQKVLPKFFWEFARNGSIPNCRFKNDSEGDSLIFTLDDGVKSRFNKICTSVLGPAAKKQGLQYLSIHLEPYLSELEKAVINEKFDNEDDRALFVFVFYSICEAYGVTESIDDHDRDYWNFIRSNKKFKDLHDKHGELERVGHKGAGAFKKGSVSEEQTKNALAMLHAIEDELAKRGAFDYGDIDVRERLQLKLLKRVTDTLSDLRGVYALNESSGGGVTVWYSLENSRSKNLREFWIRFDGSELANKYDELKTGGTPQKHYADLILSEYKKSYDGLPEEEKKKLKMPNLDSSVGHEPAAADVGKRRIQFGDDKVVKATLQGEGDKSKSKSALKHASAQESVVGTLNQSKQEIVARNLLSIKDGSEPSSVNFGDLFDEDLRQSLEKLKAILETQFEKIKALKDASDKLTAYVKKFEVYRKDLEGRVASERVGPFGVKTPDYRLVYAVECICQPLILADDLREKRYAEIISSDEYDEFIDKLNELNESKSKAKAAEKQRQAQEKPQPGMPMQEKQ